MKKKLECIMAVLVILCAFLFAQKGVLYVSSWQAKQEEIRIVIDAGHGKTSGRPNKFDFSKYRFFVEYTSCLC